VIDSIGKNYRYIVIDNEAGMEHLSRRTTRDVQHLLVVSDPTQRGIVAAERISSFRNELDIRIERAYLIINRLPGVMPPALGSEISKLDIPLLGTVPTDEELINFEFSGKPLVELGNDSPVYQAVAGMLESIL
jgi:CO dehydrogenase maturation factor